MLPHTPHTAQPATETPPRNRLAPVPARYQEVRAPSTTDTPARERLDLLTRLYAEQAALGDTEYLRDHARPEVAGHHVNVFEWYAPHLAGRRAVLDWGCNHGPDSCLLRHRFGNALDLHACDFIGPDDFPAFRDYARPQYTRLTDPLTLPYPAHRFDAVVGSGVLEHTAMDGEALKEVWRVLRYGGLLVVTYLPFAHSRDERRLRAAGKECHRRLYTREWFERLLLSHGFQPLELHYQGYLPNAVRGPRPMWAPLRPLFNALWEPVLRPLWRPSSTQSVLCGIARKVNCM